MALDRLSFPTSLCDSTLAHTARRLGRGGLNQMMPSQGNVWRQAQPPINSLGGGGSLLTFNPTEGRGTIAASGGN